MINANEKESSPVIPKKSRRPLPLDGFGGLFELQFSPLTQDGVVELVRQSLALGRQKLLVGKASNQLAQPVERLVGTCHSMDTCESASKSFEKVCLGSSNSCS